MKNFKDKVVVVTGAGSGMGRAYAIEFGRLGARLALNDFDAKGLAETVALLAQSGTGGVLSQVFDVSARDAMHDFAEQVKTELGNAHVIINNAGIEGSGKPLWATNDQSYERVMNINFFGVVHGTKAFLPQLIANGEGAVVNVSSIFGLIGTPNHSDYCASKFAVRGFTEALMVELQESSVSVHLVHPGGIATNIAQHDSSQAFAGKYLSTPPEAIAKRVVQGIRRREARIVYGYGSMKTWLGACLLPLGFEEGLLGSSNELYKVAYEMLTPELLHSPPAAIALAENLGFLADAPGWRNYALSSYGDPNTWISSMADRLRGAQDTQTMRNMLAARKPQTLGSEIFAALLALSRTQVLQHGLDLDKRDELLREVLTRRQAGLAARPPTQRRACSLLLRKELPDYPDVSKLDAGLARALQPFLAAEADELVPELDRLLAAKAWSEVGMKVDAFYWQYPPLLAQAVPQAQPPTRTLPLLSTTRRL